MLEAGCLRGYILREWFCSMELLVNVFLKGTLVEEKKASLFNNLQSTQTSRDF